MGYNINEHTAKLQYNQLIRELTSSYQLESWDNQWNYAKQVELNIGFMTIEQMHVAADWLISKLDPETYGVVTVEPSGDLGYALYSETHIERRHIGYIRPRDGRVVVWWPDRKTSDGNSVT